MKDTAKAEDGKTGNNNNLDELKPNSDEPADGNEAKRRRDGRHAPMQHEVDIDDPEACTSDESGDESDYEEIDEVCDGCLEEKLDNMNCVGGIGIGVGTDTLVETQVRLSVQRY